MLGQFNPYRAGSPVQSPNVSAADLLNATDMQNQNVAGLMDTINNIGTTARSMNVIDLIKSGGLDKANSQQALNQLLGLSDGGVDANTKAVMDNLVKSKQDNESAMALARSNMEREKLRAQNDLVKQNLIGKQGLTLEQLKSQNDLTKQYLVGKQNAGIENLKHMLGIDKLNKEQEFELDKLFKTKELDYENASDLQSQKAGLDLLLNQDKNKDVISVQNGVAYLRDGTKIQASDEDIKSAEKWNKAIGLDTKLNPRDMIAIKSIESDTLNNDIDSVIDEISDDMDIFWDRGFTDKGKGILRGIVTKALSQPGGASIYSDFGSSGLKDVVLDYMKKNKLKFTDPIFYGSREFKEKE